ncbi:MAG: gamma-glutamyl-gamma-aminobutyrate hydrolase family protein [Sinobacteraceae bacterium]|nr:gamma-glutamyl-gamma-aminobutyrate hydrolase family protein [Nevskiaceae bacterium]MCP5359686.1 gamma-glutamyl-gamma-aminobutyrate hydrolase family protein [Nevskiaceae bacterium]MCP5472520.1 gamma-glutamyl-gamma-aminobutyrate hydrolase family protein [Nevskiaceae bacterium]
MSFFSRRPVIGIPADRRLVKAHPFHSVGEKYIEAIVRAADALPVLIPVLPRPLALEEILTVVDGVLFTGSPSNVEPQRYGGEPSAAGTLHDPQRDTTTLALIPAAIAAAIPVLGICRGLQEMNVAFGGTLWQDVGPARGLLRHSEDPGQPLDVQYGPAHEVQLESGSPLREWAGGAERVRVNSVHSQGVRELAPGLRVEARAPDGLVEAFSVAAAPAFAFAVQWHPEWQVMDNDFSRALFAAFGAAARARVASRQS